MLSRWHHLETRTYLKITALGDTALKMNSKCSFTGGDSLSPIPRLREIRTSMSKTPLFRSFLPCLTCARDILR